jgi:hypothetical protein
MLDAILGANASRSPRESFRKQMERDNMEQLRSEGEVPLQYDETKVNDMGDVTSLWKPFGKLWRK